MERIVNTDNNKIISFFRTWKSSEWKNNGQRSQLLKFSACALECSHLRDCSSQDWFMTPMILWPRLLSFLAFWIIQNVVFYARLFYGPKRDGARTSPRKVLSILSVVTYPANITKQGQWCWEILNLPEPSDRQRRNQYQAAIGRIERLWFSDQQRCEENSRCTPDREGLFQL